MKIKELTMSAARKVLWILTRYSNRSVRDMLFRIYLKLGNTSILLALIRMAETNFDGNRALVYLRVAKSARSEDLWLASLYVQHMKFNFRTVSPSFENQLFHEVQGVQPPPQQVKKAAELYAIQLLKDNIFGSIEPLPDVPGSWNSGLCNKYLYRVIGVVFPAHDYGSVYRASQYLMRSNSYDPDIVFQVIDKFLFAKGEYEKIIEIVEYYFQNWYENQNNIYEEIPIEDRDTKFTDTIHNICNTYLLVSINLGRSIEGKDFYLENLAPTQRYFVLGYQHFINDENEEAREYFLKALYVSVTFKERSKLYGLVGVTFERQGELESAHSAYRSMYGLLDRKSAVLSQNEVQRYFHFALAMGYNKEAAAIYRVFLNYMNTIFSGVIQVNSGQKNDSDACEYLPESVFIIGCWSIGDDLFRLGVFTKLHGRGKQLGISTDPRLVNMIKRSYPNSQVMSVTRLVGESQVPISRYQSKQIGLNPRLRNARIDSELFNLSQTYETTILNETLIYQSVEIENFAELPYPDEPMIVVDAELEQFYRDYLRETFGAKRTVGISWASGFITADRKQYYFKLADFFAEYAGEDLIFVCTQYDFDPQEIKEVKKLFKVDVHVVPDLDLRNDLEGLAALCVALDTNIVTCTAIREICGAVGANALSLNIAQWAPEQWREGIDQKDLIFPSIHHLHIRKYDDVGSLFRDAIQKCAAIDVTPN